MKSGNTKSCGCLRESNIRNLRTTHGQSTDSAKYAKEYRAWCHAKGRCYCKSDHKYPEYGGRGIAMSDEWRADFSAFLRDIGPAPSSKHTLERKDVNGHYCKSNCKWATAKEQANNLRGTIFVSMPSGGRMTISDLAKVSGIKRKKIEYLYYKHGAKKLAELVTSLL